MEDIIRFFDSHAEKWDSYWKEEEFGIIRKILERSSLSQEDSVLDIASGTGILVPYFLEFGVVASCIQGIDISPKMVEIFSQKFPQIPVICGDFLLKTLPENNYSYAIIFNSFPHFLEPEKVFEKVSKLLKPKGKLVVAHTKTREALDRHHQNSGSTVRTHRLLEDKLFLQYYQKYGFTDVILDNSLYFYTQGVKK
ncbi:MAG: class I SAM-dependent methyltransferase [Candidatus Brocadiae bacterium]|nr:class I SAM-dependent methyltransferase [Candidatus Brocadiia bacterium]